MEAITIESVSQIDSDAGILKAVEEAAEWFEDEARIDWDAFWDRLDQCGYFMPDMVSPAARRIQKYVRALRSDNEANLSPEAFGAAVDFGQRPTTGRGSS